MDHLRIGACVAALCWAGVENPDRQQSGDDELTERLTAVAVAAKSEFELAGLAVGVALGGEPLLTDGWGYVHRAARAPAGPESLFPAGALTPSLVTLGILMLVDGGAVAPEDPLAKHLVGRDLGELGELTVDQLLRHTSGVPAEDVPEGEDLLAWLVQQPLDHVPGHCAVYSGGNTYLLGRVLEEVSGMSVPEFVRSHIAAPLVLDATYYCERGLPVHERAESTQEVMDELVDDPLLIHLFDAPGLCSSVEDLLRLLNALAERELMSDATLDRLRDPAPIPDGTPVTLVGGFSRTPLGDHEGISLGGGLMGGDVHAAWYPELELTVAVFASSEDAPLAIIERRLTRAFLGEVGPELIGMTLPDEALERYVGGYYIGCLNYLVEAVDGNLCVVPSTGSPFALLYQGDHAFVAEKDPELRVTFDVLDGLARSLTLDDHGFVTVATRME